VDGTTVYICIVVDDYSRYALAAVVGLEKTTEWTADVTQHTVQKAGTPDQIVTDNGREFISVWQERLTKFGELLVVWSSRDHRLTILLLGVVRKQLFSFVRK
jgi:transposase InsO family protein